ncbi:MAG: tetratricopeptide repeat protein [Myxococcales bacterium]|nr:tetratricopeptide repeat protein [Myxococcales bacterium]MCB9644897.1 tetratricopeptide repeat protein [Myxococcales bacterium]
MIPSQQLPHIQSHDLSIETSEMCLPKLPSSAQRLSSARKGLGYLVFGFASLFFLGGCATTQVRQPAKTVVQADPMIFYAKGGKVVHFEQMNPKSLFDQAAEHFQAKEYDKARLYYSRLLTAFPKSEYRTLSMYNLALTYERLKQHKHSIILYNRIIEERPGTEECRDAQFRLGAAYLITKQFPLSAKMYNMLAERKDVESSDMLEVLASLGLSYYHMKNEAMAEDAFRRTLRLFHKEKSKQYLGNDYFAAMAQFYIGRLHDDRFRARAFRPDKELMKKDLNYKAKELLTAQAHYLRSIRIRNPRWVVASLFRIGDMYRQMYDDMIHAPVPKHLDKEEQQVYAQMLKKKIRILLDKAILAFEKNLQAAENYGVQDDEFIKKTQQQLLSLRSRILKDYLQGPTEHETKQIKAGLKTPTAKRATPTTAPVYVQRPIVPPVRR